MNVSKIYDVVVNERVYIGIIDHSSALRSINLGEICGPAEQYADQKLRQSRDSDLWATI